MKDVSNGLSNKTWLLPDGVDELLPEQALRLEHLRALLLSTFGRWGYQLVFPPLVEYLDALHIGAGQPLALQTFQLTDQLSGRQLGVRPDMTPQLARMDAASFSDQQSDGVRRLCYCGTVLRARPRELHARRTQVQAGIELFGHSGLSSELEVLSLMSTSLNVLGIKALVLDLGHVGIINALLDHLFTEDQCAIRAKFLAIVERRSFPEMQQFVIRHIELPDHRAMCLALLDLQGPPAAVLEQLAQQFQPLVAAIRPLTAELEALVLQLAPYFAPGSLHLDLVELKGFHYYTGLTFAAYHPASRQALLKGGRYDNVGKAFGAARPAVGFSLDLLQLLNVSPEQPIATKAIFAPCLVATDPEQQQAAEQALQALVAQLRGVGETVIQALEPALNPNPCSAVFDRQLIQRDGIWVIELL